MRKFFIVVISLIAATAQAADKTIVIPVSFVSGGIEYGVTQVTFWKGQKTSGFINVRPGQVIKVPAGMTKVCLHRKISAKKAVSACKSVTSLG